MSYIGNTPAENYASFLTETFSVSATASYTLSHAVSNENDIRLVINGVVQQPGSGKAYTASGTTLTLTSATVSGDVMYAVYLGRALQTVNPPNASVGTAQLADSSVTSAKLASGAVSNTPAFTCALNSTHQNIAHATATTIAWSEVFDTDSAFASNTFTVPSGKDGKYFFHTMIRWNDDADYDGIRLALRKNGTDYASAYGRNEFYQTQSVSVFMDLVAGNTVDVQCRQTSGGTKQIGTSDAGYISIFEGFRIIT